MPTTLLRHLARGAAAAAVLCLSSAANAADLIPFKVGEAAPANTFLAIWMAEAAGFYEAQGLKLEIVHMVGRPRVGPRPLLRPHPPDAYRHVVGRARQPRRRAAARHRLAQQYHPRHDVRRAADQDQRRAQGRHFRHQQRRLGERFRHHAGLRRLGHDAREDVTVKEIGTDRLTPLRNGAVAATAPGRAATQPGHWRLGCASFSISMPSTFPWLYSGLTVDRDYLANNRDTLMRFLKATIEGNYLAISDEKRAKEVLAKELKLTDAKIIDQSYANFKAETPPNAEIDRKGAENVLTTVAPASASQKLDRLHRHQPDRRAAQERLHRLDGEEVRQEPGELLAPLTPLSSPRRRGPTHSRALRTCLAPPSRGRAGGAVDQPTDRLSRTIGGGRSPPTPRSAGWRP